MNFVGSLMIKMAGLMNTLDATSFKRLTFDDFENKIVIL